MEKAINLILDDKQPMRPGAEFIDIENDAGRSIKIGTTFPKGNYTRLRITLEDIENMHTTI